MVKKGEATFSINVPAVDTCPVSTPTTGWGEKRIKRGYYGIVSDSWYCEYRIGLSLIGNASAGVADEILISWHRSID